MNKQILSVALFGALLVASASTFTSCKDYDDDINGLQEQVDANNKTLDEKLTNLQTAMGKANADITSAQTAAAAAQAAADKAQSTGDAAAVAAAQAAQAAAAASQAAAQAKVEAIAEATRLVNELKTVVNGKLDKSVYDAKMLIVDGHLDVIDGRLDKLEAADIAIKIQITTLEKFKEEIDKLSLTTAFPELQGQVATLITDLNLLKGRVGKNETDIATLKTDLQVLSSKIDALNVRLTSVEEDVVTIGNKLNTLSELLSKRLTALTFAPTEFINGIEVINFATLKYKPWTQLLADGTDGTTELSINDGKTTAVYYASPSGVKKANIKSLSILTNEATNRPRATTTDIITATLNDEIENGKMIVNLKKNTTNSFDKPNSGTTENFTLLALRAEIELTADEVEKGAKPTVVSDWARLAETSEVPFIHDKTYVTDVTEDLDAAAPKAPHFYPYSKIHNAAVSSTEGKFILQSVVYTESLDLKSLVDICDKNDHRYVADNYNLGFEFNLVDYKLLVGGVETNQKQFATITDGVITSKAIDGTTNNQDAIGREPLVQVVLRDKANNKVVDVRYFKIEWIAKAENNDLGEADFAATFDFNNCNQQYTNTVKDEFMTSAYTLLGIDKAAFHRLYTLENKVYTTAEEAIAGTPASTTLGAITAIAPGYNLKWNLPIANNVITPEEYIAGKAIRTVYGKYINNITATQTCTFKLELTLDVAKMAFNAGYNQSYWNVGAVLSSTNKEKTFLVNPALNKDTQYGTTKFFDCQIIASVLKGYNKSAAINTPLDLVSNAQNASLVFDADRLNILEGTGWAVSSNGSTLTKSGETAATIDAGGVISLYESTLPTLSAHGTPTNAAKALLGKSVPVKLIASYCNGQNGELEAELDHFLVKFISPLTMTLADVTDSFTDLISGGSIININKIATIKEAFGEKLTVWENNAGVTGILPQWYHVQRVTWNLDAAKTNLKKEGNNIIITNDPMASDWSDFSADYKLSATPNNVNATSLKFENNSGAALQQAITISVPVYATAKWTAELTDASKKYVKLTVNPGVTK